ncbi:MAG: hypothetical protein ABEJ78_04150 [Haloferacaceae archaeon]
MRDRSLDEFLSTAASDGDADGATDADADVDATNDAASDAGGEQNTDGVATGTDDLASTDAASTDGLASPATPTMRFTHDGVCPACGASSPRLWNDGDRFVCADCKEF